MRKLMISAAAMTAFAALLASAPANAEYNYGPTQNAGQCWKPSLGHTWGGFGSWGACAQTASTPVKRTVRHARHH
jgi:hypothetical protein